MLSDFFFLSFFAIIKEKKTEPIQVTSSIAALSMSLQHLRFKFFMHLCFWKTLSQKCPHSEIRHLFGSKTKVKRRIQMLVSRLPDTWMANESWGRETLAQNWGHYAKLCSRQKCISVSQIYHDGEKKASDMLLLSLGCVRRGFAHWSVWRNSCLTVQLSFKMCFEKFF